jgi:hypothetical protein
MRFDGERIRREYQIKKQGLDEKKAILQTKLDRLKNLSVIKTPTPVPTPSENDDKDDKDDRIPEPPLSEATVTENSERRRRIIQWWVRTFKVKEEQNPYVNDPIPESERDAQIREVEDKIRPLKKKVEHCEKVEKLVTDGLAIQFVALFEIESKLNDYEIIVGKELKQGSVELGKFTEYRDGKGYYKDGHYCWQVQSGRKAEIKFVCGNDNQLVSLLETAQCFYSGVFSTPALCSEERKLELYNMTLPMLKTIVQELAMETA